MIVRRRLATYAIGALALTTGVYAQFPTKPGTTEISIYTGGSFDFPGASAAAGGFSFVVPPATAQPAIPKLTPGRKSQPIIGGEASVALTRFLWIYGDYGYMFADHQVASAIIPVTSTTIRASVTDVNDTSRHYWTGTGGAELSFPTVHRIVPLLRLGGGYVHNSYTFYAPPLKGQVGGISYSDPGYSIVKAENIPAINFGGGVRWYWKERQGLRVMVDALRMSHSVDDVAIAEGRSGLGYLFVSRRSGARITVGYYFHFGR